MATALCLFCRATCTEFLTVLELKKANYDLPSFKNTRTICCKLILARKCHPYLSGKILLLFILRFIKKGRPITQKQQIALKMKSG